MMRQTAACLGTISLTAALYLRGCCSCEESSYPLFPGSSGEYALRSSKSTSQGNDLSIVYDSRTRCPKYVIERLFRRDAGEDEDKTRPPFHSSTSITDVFRVQSRDYADSNYDRGHMAPSADFVRNKDLKHLSFSMANICPQVPELNKGFWARFEAWIRHLLTKEFDEVIVITGPVFAPLFINNQWIHINRTVGTFPRLISVPTHFFKVVIGRNLTGESGKGQTQQYQAVGAYLVPNVNTVDIKTPLSALVVRLDQLESIVGHSAWLPYLTDKDRQTVDSVVPEGRDIARLLCVKNMRALSSPAEIDSPQLSRDPNILYINNSYTPIAVRKGDKHKIKGGVLHLCECVDCNRPLFAK